MNEFRFGINLSFTVKRWPEPDVWARLVRETLGLDLVQFTFDLLDPWWPVPQRTALASQVREAAHAWDIKIHSAFVGLANYTYNNLLHPDPAGRQAAMVWWKQAIEVAAAIGARAVGGPPGGMSVTDAADEKLRSARYTDLLLALEELTATAAAAGLQEFFIEPTPLPREFPHTIAQAQQLLADLKSCTSVPVHYVLDVGHALYQPLYGQRANTGDWLAALRSGIGLFHLQNTDFQSDSHWGWPDVRGQFDVASFAREVDAAGLSQVPTVLEVFYPFEMADEQVLANVVSSVQHCVAELGI